MIWPWTCLVRNMFLGSMRVRQRLSTGCQTPQPPTRPGCTPSALVHASTPNRARAQVRTPRAPAGAPASARRSAARAAAPSAAAFRRQRAALAAAAFAECAPQRRAFRFAAHRACCILQTCTVWRVSVWRQHAAPAAAAVSDRASWQRACLAIACPHAPIIFVGPARSSSSAASAHMLPGRTAPGASSPRYWRQWRAAAWQPSGPRRRARRFNVSVFGGQLPADLAIGWNAHLLTTAGLTHYRRDAAAAPGEAPRCSHGLRSPDHRLGLQRVRATWLEAEVCSLRQQATPAGLQHHDHGRRGAAVRRWGACLPPSPFP